MERKSFPFELEEKGLDEESRTFKGYAAVCGIRDAGGDVIDYGAFTKTLQEAGHRVKIFWIHDFKEPIGKPVVYDDGTIGLKQVPKSKLPRSLVEKWPQATGGLFVHGYISPTTKGNDALTLMRDTVLDELSIGYKSIKEKMLDDGPEGEMTRHLKELGLMDISPVPLAMQEAAIVTEVKEMEEDEFDQLEPWDSEKPYPNEHACRLKDPGQYDTCRRGTRQSGGKTYSIIFCKKTGGKMEEQAYRYPKGSWSASEARAHCSKHGGRFEAAAKDIAEEGIIKALIQEAELQRQRIEEI